MLRIRFVLSADNNKQNDVILFLKRCRKGMQKEKRKRRGTERRKGERQEGKEI